jgi:DNA-binding NarL/FixJ family response regulator
MRRTRALLVNGSGLLRHGLRSVLEEADDVELVGEASIEQDAVQRILAEKPGVTVVDATDDSVDPALLMESLEQGSQEELPRVLMLANDLDDRILRAFRVGARGILLEHANPRQLVAAIHVVAAGYALFVAPTSYPLNVSARSDSRSAQSTARALGRLTPRESDILQLIAAGCSNAEICAKLGRSESTVKSHVQHLLNKLGLPSRVHAVIYAYETGFARADESRVTR